MGRPALGSGGMSDALDLPIVVGRMVGSRCVQVATASVLISLAPASDIYAQVLGVSLGVTSSGVDWTYPPPPPSDYPRIIGLSSNTDRRSVTVAGTIRTDVWRWLAVQTGLRVVPKGFEVTGPTFHMIYAEVPLLGILQTGTGRALFIEGGLVLGVRGYCRRFMRTVDGFHEDNCGAVTTSYGRDLMPLRRWDLSWNLGPGLRLGADDRWIVLVVRAQRSFVGIQPDVKPRRMLNRVLSFSVGLEWRVGPARRGEVETERATDRESTSVIAPRVWSE